MECALIKHVNGAMCLDWNWNGENELVDADDGYCIMHCEPAMLAICFI